MLGSTTTLRKAFSALLLFNNTNVDNSQRIYILAVSAPSNVGLTPRFSSEELIAGVRFEDVSSVVCLLRCPASSSKHSMNDAPVLPHALGAYKPLPERNRAPCGNAAPNRPNNQSRRGVSNLKQMRGTKNCAPFEHCGHDCHWVADNSANDRSILEPCLAPGRLPLYSYTERVPPLLFPTKPCRTSLLMALLMH